MENEVLLKVVEVLGKGKDDLIVWGAFISIVQIVLANVFLIPLWLYVFSKRWRKIVDDTTEELILGALMACLVVGFILLFVGVYTCLRVHMAPTVYILDYIGSLGG